MVGVKRSLLFFRTTRCFALTQRLLSSLCYHAPTYDVDLPRLQLEMALFPGRCWKMPVASVQGRALWVLCRLPGCFWNLPYAVVSARSIPLSQMSLS